ncbi:hypothetical protein Tco_0409302 [Tanacetum coccineum]
MKMEIPLEPTSNKLMVEHAEYDESNTYVLERFYTSAGNPVKEILLKLNLPDHRILKMVVKIIIRTSKRTNSRRSNISSSNKREDSKGFFITTSLKEPKTISQALKDESWVEAMQEEELQFKLQQCCFSDGTSEEEVYVHQPPGFVDPAHPNKVYKENGLEEMKMVKRSMYYEYRDHDWFPDVVAASRPDIMFAVCGEPDGNQQPGDGQFHCRRPHILAMQKRQKIVQILLLRQNMLQLLIVVGKISKDSEGDKTVLANTTHLWSVNSGSLYVNTGSLYVNSVQMANLKYSDKHNMVAFLKKQNESVGFTEVVDFLKGTSLRYALTHNPTIYDSLVKQFWQTATVRTLSNRTQQLVASVNSKEYTMNEASVRSKLQLADATGIHNLSDADIKC